MFVTGTDTNVGKTYVTAHIARHFRAAGRRVGAYKPVCSGAIATAESDSSTPGWQWDDVNQLQAAIGGDVDHSRISPQRFLAPLAPPQAAHLEGKYVDSQLLRSGVEWWLPRVELLLVEGVGGLLCPLTHTETVADLATDFFRRYEWPLLVVARATLGTINHTLLTLEVAAARGLPVAGVLLNEAVPAGHDASIATNAAEIEQRSGVPVWGIVPHGLTSGLPPADWFARIDIRPSNVPKSY